jgi:RNA polymerase sigma-70 factor (ECF subfamily)
VDENAELETLLRLAQDGDATARERLVGLLRVRARRYAEHHLGEQAWLARFMGQRSGSVAASDLAQEAFVKIFKKSGFNPGDFPTVPQLLAWLNEVVRNAVTDLRRRYSALIRDIGREVAGGDLFPTLAANTTSPAERVEQDEEAAGRAARLETAIGRLPESQRAVFLLRFRENLPFEEIAERVGVSVGNARVLMTRATERLRQELGGELGDQA